MNASESGGMANNRSIEALKDFPKTMQVIKGQVPPSRTYRYVPARHRWPEKEPMDGPCRECSIYQGGQPLLVTIHAAVKLAWKYCTIWITSNVTHHKGCIHIRKMAMCHASQGPHSARLSVTNSKRCQIRWKIAENWIFFSNIPVLPYFLPISGCSMTRIFK